MADGYSKSLGSNGALAEDLFARTDQARFVSYTDKERGISLSVDRPKGGWSARRMNRRRWPSASNPQVDRAGTSA